MPNMNDRVRIKLRPKGMEMLKKHWAISGHDINETMDVLAPQWREGVVEMPLWDVANCFGHEMCMGNEAPIEMEFEFV